LLQNPKSKTTLTPSSAARMPSWTKLALDEVALVWRVLIAEQGDLPLVGRQRRAEALISSSFARYVFPAPGRPTIR
jgi:hypothetical protein